LLVAVASALVLTATAGAVSGGRFVGTPTCTADPVDPNSTDAGGAVTCTARVAGLEQPDLASLYYTTEWACTADQSITVLADNALQTGASVKNGRIFTVSSLARHPRFYENIFGVDFGCPGDNWTAVSYTDVTISLLISGLSYDVGTVYPS
jgi:hypothetical protein